MTTLAIIILFVLAHYIGDFVFQPLSWHKSQAMNPYRLLAHSLIYSAVLFCVAEVLRNLGYLGEHYFHASVLFGILCLVTHLPVDALFDTLVSDAWKEKKMFKLVIFTSIDHILHIIILLILLDTIFI